MLGRGFGVGNVGRQAPPVPVLINSMGDSATRAVYQRDSITGGTFSLGAGTIPVGVKLKQAYTLVEWQLRDADSPATILVAYTSLGSKGKGSQILSIPAPAGPKHYLIDLRFDGAGVLSTTQPIGMGEVVAIAGQSLAEIMFNNNYVTGDGTTLASLSITPSAFGSVLGAYANNPGNYPPVADGVDIGYPPSVWAIPADATNIRSSWVAEFLNRAITKSGVVCGVIGYAVGGTGIDSWLPGYSGVNSGHYDKLKYILNVAGGKFGSLLWMQGHYESKNGTNATTYRNALNVLFVSLANDFPAWVALGKKIMLATIPAIGAYAGSTTTTVKMVRDTARAYQVTNAANCDYVEPLDATLSGDLVHPNMVGCQMMARPFFRTWAAQRGLGIRPSAGPQFTSGVRASASPVIVMTLTNPNTDTGFTGTTNLPTQFQVLNVTQGNTVLTVSSVDITVAHQISLTLSATPLGTDVLTVSYRLTSDNATSNAAAIYDNITDADGITNGRQVGPASGIYTIAAPG